jgi:signal transduction histidine kinase
MINEYAWYVDQYVETIGPIRFSEDKMHKIAFYTVTNNPVERLREIQSVIDTLRDIPRISTISSYYHLGLTYMELGEVKHAIQAFQKGLELNQRLPTAVAFRHALYEGIAEAHTATGNHREALYWIQRKSQSEDSIKDAKNNALLHELQVKYETASKEQQILEQQLELEHSRRQRNLILIVLTVLIGLGIVLYLAQRRRHALQRTIAQQELQLQQQRIAELQNQGRLMALNAMIAGQEEERKRLAQDIHDGIGGILATVKIQFDRLLHTNTKEHATTELEKSRELLDEACNEIRRVAHNMMPHALVKMGLIPALEDLAANIESSNKLRVSLKCIDVRTSLSE